jgi:hypothetical protein
MLVACVPRCVPRDVVRLGGAADQVGGFALLLSARELDRGLFGERFVRDLLPFSLSPAQAWPVGRVALRLETFPPGRGPARSSCLVSQEEEADARGAGCDRVAENDVAVAELDVGQCAHADNRDQAAEGIRAEA